MDTRLLLATSEFDTDQTTGTAGSLEFGQGETGGKSVYKAALFSALVPGGGQYYLGNRKKARYFFAAEVLTWVGYLSFYQYGQWRKDDYIGFAASHANAQLEGKSDDFVDLVGFYDNTDDYNGAGRVGDPGRPYFPDVPEYHWQWQSTEERLAFRDIKNRSRDAFERAEIMLGLAVVDRMVSVIDSIRDALRSKRRIRTTEPAGSGPKFEFSIDPFSSRRQLSFAIYPGF